MTAVTGRLHQHAAARVGNEGRAVEGQAAFIARARGHGHLLPQRLRVEGRELRLRADCRWLDDDFGTPVAVKAIILLLKRMAFVYCDG